MVDSSEVHEALRIMRRLPVRTIVEITMLLAPFAWTHWESNPEFVALCLDVTSQRCIALPLSYPFLFK